MLWIKMIIYSHHVVFVAEKTGEWCVGDCVRDREMDKIYCKRKKSIKIIWEDK